MEQITITFDKQGNPTIVTEGFKGNTCQLATHDLAKKLGATVSDQETAEFYETEVMNHATTKR